jgi:3-oxoacyl-[acyl-carrier-protein] synthase III/NAD(P)-dependent dehydrogenase (short-subunit alcohol dehydrogenase family)
MATFENYIFTGYGHSVGDYLIKNEDLEKAVDKEYLEQFNTARIEAGENFIKAKEKDADLTAFKYMAELKMGFRDRNHVVPFPPNRSKYKRAKNALDLGVEAVQKAIFDAGVNPEEISAWLVGTATPQEQAPGIAATLKAYFVNFENQSETMTLTSACGGFNYNLERAVNYFKTHPEAQHVVVCHTEVMSELLIDTTEFVPYVTFADGAAAVVISRQESDKKEGLVSIVNYEDPQMINYLGASAKGRMYMQAGIVKDRATENLVRNSKEVLQELNWELSDVDLMIPHQTGNAIVHGVVKILGFDFKKVYQKVQYEHGNLSGASIPAAMSRISREEGFVEGQKILTATAGLGGENGAFAYVVPKKQKIEMKYKPMQDQVCFITGASGGIGEVVAKEAACRGAKLILHYSSNDDKMTALAELLRNDFGADVDVIKANFSKPEDVNDCVEQVKSKFEKIDYLVHTAATTGSLGRASDISIKEFNKVLQINQMSAIELTKGLFPFLKSTILYVGSVAEDAEFPGSVAYVASKRGLHGFAGSFAPEALRKGVRSIYYMPGMVDGGMAKYLDEKQKQATMMAIGQKEATSLPVIAQRIVNSLYIPKVSGTNSTYEDVLTVRRDGYYADDIHYSIV